MLYAHAYISTPAPRSLITLSFIFGATYPSAYETSSRPDIPYAPERM